MKQGNLWNLVLLPIAKWIPLGYRVYFHSLHTSIHRQHVEETEWEKMVVAHLPPFLNESPKYHYFRKSTAQKIRKFTQSSLEKTLMRIKIVKEIRNKNFLHGRNGIISVFHFSSKKSALKALKMFKTYSNPKKSKILWIWIHKIQNADERLPSTEIGCRQRGGSNERKINEWQEGWMLRSQTVSAKIHFLNVRSLTKGARTITLLCNMEENEWAGCLRGQEWAPDEESHRWARFAGTMLLKQRTRSEAPGSETFEAILLPIGICWK